MGGGEIQRGLKIQKFHCLQYDDLLDKGIIIAIKLFLNFMESVMQVGLYFTPLRQHSDNSSLYLFSFHIEIWNNLGGNYSSELNFGSCST